VKEKEEEKENANLGILGGVHVIVIHSDQIPSEHRKTDKGEDNHLHWILSDIGLHLRSL